MRIPTRVELGFGATWRTEPSEIVWTDITSYVLSHRHEVRVERGATRAWGEPDPGTLSLLVLNRDRRFDPAEPSSPYVGQLVAGVPIRVLAEPVEDDPQPIFTGFVTGWPQRFTGGRGGDGFHVVPLTAVDGFEKLATARLPRSYLETQLEGKPYFPMGDTSYEWESVNVPRTGRYTAQPTRSEILTEPGDLHPATRFDGDYLARYEQNPHGGIALVEIDQNAETGSFLTLFDRAETSRSGEFFFAPPLTQVWIGVEIISASRKEARIVRRRAPFPPANVHGEPNPWSVHVSAPISYSKPFTLGWGTQYIDSLTGEAIIIYFNGFPLPMSFSSDIYEWAQPFGRQVTVGGSPRPGTLWAGWQGSIAHVVLDLREPNTSPPPTRPVMEAFVSNYHAAVIGALDGHRAAERIGWVLDQVDWPAEARDLAEGRTRLGPVNPAERTALDYARLVDATESGRLFVAADGKLTLRDRWRRWLDPSATVPQLNITGSTGVYFQDIARDPQSTDLMVNRASVTRENGRPQVRRNDTSIDTHGERGFSIASMHRNDLGARGLASFIVGTRGEPLNMVESVKVPLHGVAAADAAMLLSLDLGDRVNLAYESRGVGDPISMDVIVDGISHSISGAGTEWWCELYLAPVPQRSPFIVGESTVGGPDVVTY